MNIAFNLMGIDKAISSNIKIDGAILCSHNTLREEFERITLESYKFNNIQKMKDVFISIHGADMINVVPYRLYFPNSIYETLAGVLGDINNRKCVYIRNNDYRKNVKESYIPQQIENEIIEVWNNLKYRFELNSYENTTINNVEDLMNRLTWKENM